MPKPSEAIQRPTTDQVMRALVEQGRKNPEATLGIAYVVNLLTVMAAQGEEDEYDSMMYSGRTRLPPIITTYYRTIADMLRAAFDCDRRQTQRLMDEILLGKNHGG